MSDGQAMLLLPALKARQAQGGQFVLTRKFLDGVLEYTRHWPGRVMVAMQRALHDDGNLDHVEVDPRSQPFELRWLDWDDRGQVLALIGEAGVVLAALVDKHVHLPELCRAAQPPMPLVYIAEYSEQTRRQIIHTETANPLLRWRRGWWNAGLERRYRRAVALAAGVQCNGIPTFQAYRDINPTPLLYFDTRVRREQLVSEQTLAARIAELLGDRAGQGIRPLRLAFSGRLIAMKGADHLALVAAALRGRGVAFTLDICGGGALESRMRAQIAELGLQDQVRLRGVLDFGAELLPFIAREVDLFVCCHRQGDPSCTYLETMSCGVPIAGYDNEAFRGLVETSGVGWIGPLDQPQALAEQIAALDQDRPALARAAHAALAFARQHTFEATMRVRIEHLRACAAAAAAPLPAGVSA